MNFSRDYRLENFIMHTQWAELEPYLQTRMKVCLIDLLSALIVGAGSDQFRAGKKMIDDNFGRGDIPVIGTEDKYTFFGATSIMGHSSNAYDIDDGHNIIRAHPGTSFISGLLAAGHEADISLKELLVSMYVSYESTIRMAFALMDHYQYAHSSGTFGSFGVAVGTGRIKHLTPQELNNLLSIAEFHAPLVPSKSASYPSMNKDGVPFGAMIGALAYLDAASGFIGKMHMLDEATYHYLKDDLGQKHHVMDLYFKPYPCCRWAHPAIDACLEILSEHPIDPSDISRVEVFTFQKATSLSQDIPTTIDEAQYNISYPIAATLLFGEFGIDQVDHFDNKDTHHLMEKVILRVDPDLEKAFPEKRFCRIEIGMKTGEIYASSIHEPQGEAKDGVNMDWIQEKFRRITKNKLTAEKQSKILRLISQTKASVRELMEEINRALIT